MRAVCWLASDAAASLPRTAPERPLLIRTVVRCGMATDSDLQELALLVLGLWAERIPMHTEIVAANVLEPLVLAVDYPLSPLEPLPILHMRGARALGCLSVHACYQSLIVAEGALPPLLELMRSTSHPQVRLSNPNPDPDPDPGPDPNPNPRRAIPRCA